VDNEFSISELTDDDIPAVVTLCRTALDVPEDAAEAAEIVLRLRETSGTRGWAQAPRRLAGFIAVAPTGSGPAAAGGALSGAPTAAAGGRLVGVVLGSLSHRDVGIGHVDLIAVDPADRRRGIGRALMARVESALATLGAGEVVVAGNAPYYAWPGIDVRYTPAVCAAMAFGFEQDRPAWNMTVDLRSDDAPASRPTAQAEKRLAADGITVRRATGDDVPVLVEFAMDNFGTGWAGEITHSVGRDQAGCHIAVGPDGAVLGFAAYGSSRPSWFGPMGTSASARGLGIGGVLLRRCLAEQRAEGHRRVQIGWVGPVPFYSSVAGARVERVFFRYRKRL
jgi:predicted N-acetyltransferase YhbS